MKQQFTTMSNYIRLILFNDLSPITLPQRNLAFRVSTRTQLKSSTLCKSSSVMNFPAENSADSGLTRFNHQEDVKHMVRERIRRREEGGDYRLVDHHPAAGTVSSWNLDEAYDRCLDLVVKDGSTMLLNNYAVRYPLLNSGLSFILKTAMLIWKPERRKALAALLAWFRRTDELVDGSYHNKEGPATPEVLDKWEERLVDLFQGRPHDIYDAAVFDVVSKHSIDIQLFKDFIDGMRMDLTKTKYKNFDELYLYAYHVAGSWAIMLIQLMGLSRDSNASMERIYTSAVSFAISLQLTDILRDVVEDHGESGRIYLPQDELASAGISEDCLFRGKVTPAYRGFVKRQLERVRMYADEGKSFIKEMKPCDACCFWLLSSLSGRVLDKIEANDYDLTKPTPVGIVNVIIALAVSFIRPYLGIF